MPGININQFDKFPKIDKKIIRKQYKKLGGMICNKCDRPILICGCNVKLSPAEEFEFEEMKHIERQMKKRKFLL